jgi:ribosomal protein S1
MHHDMPIVLLKGVFMNMHTQSGISHAAPTGRSSDNTSKIENFRPFMRRVFRTFGRGIITGEVIKVEKGMVFVDIGYKSEGEISMSEFRDSQGNVTVKQGDRVEVVLVRKANEKGFPVLSKSKIEDVRRRKTIEEAFHKGRAVRGKIISPVKGGYTVDIGLRAFLPGSQVDIFPSKGIR